MTVAVLGASGFVGGHLVRYLRDHDFDVRPVFRRPPARSIDGYRLADVCDVYALRDALRGCDAVVHAALGDDTVITDSVAPVYAAAEAVGIRRMIYLSSGSVHGQSPAAGTDERTPLSTGQSFSYNNAKVRAERRLQRLRRRGTVELVILRPTIVFGPGSRWVFDFADRLRNGTAFVVDGARGICNSIYVDNLSYGVALALTSDASLVDGEAFLLADRETVRWADLFQPIADTLGVGFDRVPSLSPPALRPTPRQRYIEPVRTSDFARTVMRLIPRGAKNAVKNALRTIVSSRQSPVSTPQPPALSPQPSFIVPAEIAALQRCVWRLPHDKAARRLGYAPPVPFTEGVRRSLEWLKMRDRERVAS